MLFRSPFRRLAPSSYASRLHVLVRRGEPGRAVDRLLVAGLTAETSYLLYALVIIVALSGITVVQRMNVVRAALATTGRRA